MVISRITKTHEEAGQEWMVEFEHTRFMFNASVDFTHIREPFV